MTKVPASRKPAAFRLDDPNVVVAESPSGDPGSAAGPRRAAVVVTPMPEAANLPAPGPWRRTSRRGISLAVVFWTATGGLLALGLGLAAMRLIEDLFARVAWLGWLGTALAGLGLAALGAIVVRETVGFARLRTVEHLQSTAAAAIHADDRAAAETVVRHLLSLVRGEPRLSRSRAVLRSHLDEIIDGADLLRLAERELMAPLDEEARRSVAAAAKRVSVVTAVSPRAGVDMIFVFLTALALVRRLADLYGGRPGTLGLIRLVRHVIAHLAITGGIAASDGLLQQILGHGVAAKLSARLGEGILNGLLTARLGLAAIEVARPLPFVALAPPALGDLVADIMKPRQREPADPSKPIG
jgi:putative membrane protein